MTALRWLCILIGLAALVTAVLRARAPGTFPLVALLREWLPPGPAVDGVLIGVFAGTASVGLGALVVFVLGWGEFSRVVEVTPSWLAAAFLGVGAKALYVVFEEIVFRGALMPLIRGRAGTIAAVAGSALVFALAHGGRSGVELAILFVDGIGFGLAYVITGSLWVPVIWHLSRNLSVWLLYGSGTVDLAPGPFAFTQTVSGLVVRIAERGVWLDLVVAVLVVGLAVWALAPEDANPQKS